MMAANAEEDMVTAEAKCDIIHMSVMLELNEKRRFPERSELNSWVEINIEKQHLLDHRWKVHTRLVRPVELSYSAGRSSPQPLFETEAEIAIQYQHRPGCDGVRDGIEPCRCVLQNCRRDWVAVPFPADVCAATLSNCAEYPAHPFSGGARRRSSKKAKAGVERGDDGDDGATAAAADDQPPTQMSLVPKIAMMQEIWSCPPDGSNDADADAQGNKRWVRRAVILWSFKTMHSIDSNGKLITAEGGRTTWRFLTILDPVSEYHLRNSLLRDGEGVDGECRDSNSVSSPSSTGSDLLPVARDAIMSPSPTYQQHLNATMSENFAAVWDAADGTDAMSASAAAQAAYDTHLLSQAAAGAPSRYGMLANYGGACELTTPPPPSASFSTSFTQNFEAHPNHAANYMAGGVTAARMGRNGPTLLSDGLPDVPHPYLGGGGNPSSFDMIAYSQSHSQIHGWDDTSGKSIGAGAWSVGYVAAANEPQHYHQTIGPNWATTRNGGVPRTGSRTYEQDYRQQQQRLFATLTTNTGSEPDVWVSNLSAGAPTPLTLGGTHRYREHNEVWGSAPSSLGVVTENDDREDGGSSSQEWAHVGRPSAGGGVTSDFGQDWEEVDVKSGRPSSASNMSSWHPAPQGIPADPGEGEEPSVPTPPNPPPASNNRAHGKKRNRSNSLDEASRGDYPAASMPRLVR